MKQNTRKLLTPADKATRAEVRRRIREFFECVDPGQRNTLGAIEHRTCFVCQARVADGDGTAHLDLGIHTHSGACADRVTVERRTAPYPRGRWRPRMDVLTRLVNGGSRP